MSEQTTTLNQRSVSSLKQFLSSPYFFINTILVLLYPALRLYTSAGRRDLKHADAFGFTFQNSIIYTVLIIAVMGYIRSTSLRGFLIEFFGVAKIGVAALLLFAKYQFCLIYIITCILLWLVVPYPRFRAPNKFIRINSVEQFDRLLSQYQSSTGKKKGQKSSQSQETPSFQHKNKHMLFIEFYADWVLPCMLVLFGTIKGQRTMVPIQLLKFVQVNVDRFPELAKRYKINTSGFSKQLPSIVVVSNGEEEVRFPPIDEKTNKVQKVLKLDYKVLLRYFDLESRYLETREVQNASNNIKRQKNQ